MRLIDVGDKKSINPEMVIAVVQAEGSGSIIYMSGYEHSKVHSTYSYEEIIIKLLDIDDKK